MARSPLMILSVYVDDLLIVRPPSDVEAVKEKLRHRFHIKDFGPVSMILGIDIIYDTTASTLDISQQQKILDLATEFGLVGAKLLMCPLPTGTDLHVIEHTPPAHTSLKFQHLIRALLYITLATQPNVLHAVIYLSQFICTFNNTHFEAAQHILHYLNGMIKQTIHYTRHKNCNTTPIIHCNTSYGTDPLTMKSYSGNITIWASSPIVWWSRIQKTITLSTAEAELVAVTNAARQALYLHRLLPMLGFHLDQPIQIVNDNQSTITIVHKPVFAWPKRLKHVAIKHAFVHDHILWRDITVDYIPTNDNLADFLTKHIAGPKLKRNKAKLDLFTRG